MADYIDSDELDETFHEWQQTKDIEAWHALCTMIYLMCTKISNKFYGIKYCREDIISSTYERIIDKINRGVLIYDHSRRKAFSLLTTAIQNAMITMCEREERWQKRNQKQNNSILNIKEPRNLREIIFECVGDDKVKKLIFEELLNNPNRSIPAWMTLLKKDYDLTLGQEELINIIFDLKSILITL